ESAAAPPPAQPLPGQAPADLVAAPTPNKGRMTHHLQLVRADRGPLAARTGGDTVDQLLRAWTIDMERRNLTRETIRRRQLVMRTIAAEVGDPRTVGPDDLERWLDGRHLAARTRYHWISHMHAFYRWAQARGHLAADPTAQMVRPRLDRLLPRPIEDQDLAL